MADQEPDLIPALPPVAQEGLATVVADDLPTVVVEDTEAPPLGRSWAFDRGLERFVRDGSLGPRQTRGVATLLVWIDKAIHTQRGALAIHPPGYGMRDPSSIFGQPVTSLSAQVIEQDLRECLTFHPRIADVTDTAIIVDPDSEAAYVEYSVLTDPPTEDAELLSIRTTLGDA